MNGTKERAYEENKVYGVFTCTYNDNMPSPLAVGAESAAILMRYDMYVPKK